MNIKLVNIAAEGEPEELAYQLIEVEIPEGSEHYELPVSLRHTLPSGVVDRIMGEAGFAYLGHKPRGKFLDYDWEIWAKIAPELPAELVPLDMHGSEEGVVVGDIFLIAGSPANLHSLTIWGTAEQIQNVDAFLRTFAIERDRVTYVGT